MKILLVDNHPATRLGARIILQGIDGVETVDEAESAEEALHLAEELCPKDLVIVDAELGEGTSELKACKELKSRRRPPLILVYTAQNSKEDVAAASLAGADGYLHKGARREEIAETVNKTLDGERAWLLGPTEGSARTRLEAMINGAALTPRENEILTLVLARRTNREIMVELSLSLNTVKTHVRNVLKKLGFGSRQELFEVLETDSS